MKQNKKIIISNIFLAAVLASFFFFAPEVKAANNSSEGIGFYVDANLPDSQRDRGKTYYDLRMKADSKEEISFQVINTGKLPIVVSLEINNAYTNTAGGIDYKISGIKDESLVASMEEIATLSQEKVELAPEETKEVFITLQTPKEEFAGEIIGGIVATKETTEDSESSGSIVNEYSYVIGLVISENDESVNPDLSLVGIEPKLVNYKTAAVHSIRNLSPLLMDNVSMEIEIYSKESKELVWSQQKKDIKLAPSSLMNYTFYLGEEDINSGTYESKIKMNWNGQQWEFSDDFVVEASTANKLNSEAIKLNDSDQLISKPIAIILISFLILLLIALILIVINLFRKINKDKKFKKTVHKEGGEK